MPHDCAGTLQRVQHGSLRAGATENPPWTAFGANHQRGSEVELIEDFARTLGAEVVWTRDSEGDLIESLRRGELDVVVGGLRDSTPWRHQVGLTRPYRELHGQRYVMAVRQGENRWLLELEKFLPRPGSGGQ